MLFGLSQADIQKIQSVFAKYPSVVKVIIYGSRAMGNNSPSSDIDLTLLSESITSREFSKIMGELDDLMLPYQFDLSIISDIENQDLLDHIKQHGKTFYHAGRD